MTDDISKFELNLDGAITEAKLLKEQADAENAEKTEAARKAKEAEDIKSIRFLFGTLGWEVAESDLSPTERKNKLEAALATFRGGAAAPSPAPAPTLSAKEKLELTDLRKEVQKLKSEKGRLEGELKLANEDREIAEKSAKNLEDENATLRERLEMEQVKPTPIVEPEIADEATDSPEESEQSEAKEVIEAEIVEDSPKPSRGGFDSSDDEPITIEDEIFDESATRTKSKKSGLKRAVNFVIGEKK